MAEQPCVCIFARESLLNNRCAQAYRKTKGQNAFTSSFRVGGAKDRMRQSATFTFSSLISIIPTTENGNYFLLYNNDAIDIK